MENYNTRASSNYMKSTKQYTIKIDNDVYQKIMHWVDKASGEVSGLGKLTLNKTTGIIEIKSATLIKQENTGSTTDLDAAAVSKAMFELRDEPGDLNFWWHSHVNMDVFWSGTDLDTIEQIGSRGYVVATVFNKRRELKSCLYYPAGNVLFDDAVGVLVDDIPTSIIEYIPAATIEAWDKEFEEKCAVRVYTPTYFPEYPEMDGYGHEYSEHYEKDWYKNYNKAPKQNDEFDFGDNANSANIEAIHEAKIYSITPQLEVLKGQMDIANDFGQARRFLNMIFNRINKLRLPEKKRDSLKKPYLDAFNSKYPKLEKQNA